MSKEKVYYDIDGNECSLYKMVRREPEWAESRIREGEKAIDQLTHIRVSYTQAKKAVELFESEWIGQDPKSLWDWAVSEAKKVTKQSSSK